MTVSSASDAVAGLSYERRRRHLVTVAYYAAFVCLGMTNTILGPTLPGLATQTHSHLSQISFLFTAKAFGYLIGSSQGGRFYDRLPGHVLMAACLLLLGLTLAATPVIPALWLLAVVLFLWGTAEGGVEVGGTALLVWAHGARVGPWMNGAHLVAGIGAIAVPLIIARVMAATGDITAAYWIVALLILPAMVVLLRLSSPAARKAAAEGQAGSTSYVLVALFTLFLLLYVGFEVGFGGWVYTYATVLGLLTATAAAVLVSILFTSLTAGRVIGIPISARVPPGPILAVDLLLCLAGVGVILIWPASVTAIRIGCVIIGLGMATIWPTTMSLAGRHLTMTGQVAGWLFIGPGIGAMLLPWIIGQRFEVDGPRSVMVITALDLGCALIVFALLSLYIARRARLTAPGGETMAALP